jgi:hypothetical protein
LPLEWWLILEVVGGLVWILIFIKMTVLAMVVACWGETDDIELARTGSSMADLKIFAVLSVMLVALVGCGESGPDDQDQDVLVGSTATSDSVPSPTSLSPTSTVSATSSSVSSSGEVGPPDSDWNWQLTGELDMSVDVAVWDVDLFETSGDVIAELQPDGRYVICYFSAGSIEDWREDVGGIEDSAIGLPLDGSWRVSCGGG